MSIDFNVKDILHRIQVKFIHTFLPEAKKPYNLKAVHQPKLDIHGVASKADVYNIGTSPKVIEDGLTDGMKLICYLAADGYVITTPLFTLKIRVPGEYDGSETHLPGGVFPEVRLQISAEFRKYIQERVGVDFGGIEQAEGHITEVRDEATGMEDEAATIGNLLTIRGYGLKIEGDEAHRNAVGLYFEPESGAAVKTEIIAVNEPRTLKVIVPALEAGKAYTLKVVTQSSAKHSGTLLKETRELRSEFTLAAQ
jgi:hypothetical protein